MHVSVEFFYLDFLVFRFEAVCQKFYDERMVKEFWLPHHALQEALKYLLVLAARPHVEARFALTRYAWQTRNKQMRE